MKYSSADKERAMVMLHKFLKPGDTVYTVLRSVSRSGMSRRIDLYTISEDRGMVFLTGYAATVMGYLRDNRKDGIVVPGCGMDMGFHLVYSLGSTMWPHGTPQPHGRRNGEPDNSGGYALRHQWL